MVHRLKTVDSSFVIGFLLFVACCCVVRVSRYYKEKYALGFEQERKVAIALNGGICDGDG